MQEKILRQIKIFDTTLRDGEQAPGASMKAEEKFHVAQILRKMKVDVIEAGFPAVSNDDFNAVKTIAENVKDIKVAALSRAKFSDIEKCSEALVNSNRKKIHTFISTSPLHIKYKLRMTNEDVLEAVKKSVSYSRNFCEDVEWSAEDATRSEFNFLCRCIEVAINNGAKTITIADTVGYTLPNEFYKLVKKILNKVPNIDKVDFSVHCHDDLGLSVANSLAAIEAGADQVHCTINGIGERAGNAALEEIVMAIKTRSDILHCKTNIDSKFLTDASKLVSKLTKFNVPKNKAIVGKNAFAHESGIHQHGVIVNNATYEIIDPTQVGVSSSSLIIGKHSGRHALKYKIQNLGYKVDDIKFEILFKEIKELSDKEKTISNKKIITLIEKVNQKLNNNDNLKNLQK